MKQATRDQIAMLRTFADNMRDAVRMENTGMLIENDVNFHQYYTDYCGNARLADIICSTVEDVYKRQMMDGCRPSQTFFKVIFPLMKPTVATVVISDVFWIWNEFQIALILSLIHI